MENILQNIKNKLKEFNAYKLNNEFIVTEWLLDKYFMFNPSEIKYIKDNCVRNVDKDENVTYTIKLKGE